MWQVIIDTYIDGEKTGAGVYWKTYQTRFGAARRASLLHIEFTMDDGRQFKQVGRIEEVQ